MNFDCFVLKSVLLFNLWRPNLVCPKRGIRCTNRRHPEYRSKCTASGVPKKEGGGGPIECTIVSLDAFNCLYH